MSEPELHRPVDSPSLAHSAAPDHGVPRHVAIIMDGNRRWARARSLDELDGHAAGTEALRAVLRRAVQRGIPYLTVYAFSRENWARSDREVSQLFTLLAKVVDDETPELVSQGVAVRFLGRLEELPPEARTRIQSACDRTAEGRNLRLAVAFNYGSRTEIVDAVRSLLGNGTSPEDVDERSISEALYTSGMPDPDLLIRTGGEERLSNFLLWQCAYAELVTTSTLWPDFGADEFDRALDSYAQRTRRFGR